MIPGEVIPKAGEIELNAGAQTTTLTVANTGDRPVQVGSHYHFYETNEALDFDREQARGLRLDIAAGTAVRFEPGQSREVTLVPYAGGRDVYGFNQKSHGQLGSGGLGTMPAKISRAAYADMYGPTIGDKVRLADTELFIEVEEDRTTYGEEVKFGGGKVIRDGMGQGQMTRAEGAVDTVNTNAVIVDHWGTVKADVGLRDGRIAAIGKAGNPDTQPDVDIVIGPSIEAIAGEDRILTAGGFDAHIHFICPQQIDEALMSGVTTMLGGGTGPATGTNATTCTPGPWHIGRMLQAAEAFPMNLAFAGKGNASKPDGLVEQVKSGASALKLHEDWGTTPAAIDCCLRVADDYDVQVMIHTDTLNESGFVENTVNAFKGRTIHAFHTEGAGGGHAPDIIKVHAALEALIEVRPSTTDVGRIAWHLGNRHLPVQFVGDTIRLRADHVIEDMLKKLGAEVLHLDAPFDPEGGAYGHGHTHSHD